MKMKCLHDKEYLVKPSLTNEDIFRGSSYLMEEGFHPLLDEVELDGVPNSHRMMKIQIELSKDVDYPSDKLVSTLESKRK